MFCLLPHVDHIFTVLSSPKLEAHCARQKDGNRERVQPRAHSHGRLHALASQAVGLDEQMPSPFGRNTKAEQATVGGEDVQHRVFRTSVASLTSQHVAEPPCAFGHASNEARVWQGQGPMAAIACSFEQHAMRASLWRADRYNWRVNEVLRVSLARGGGQGRGVAWEGHAKVAAGAYSVEKGRTLGGNNRRGPAEPKAGPASGGGGGGGGLRRPTPSLPLPATRRELSTITQCVLSL